MQGYVLCFGSDDNDDDDAKTLIFSRYIQLALDLAFSGKIFMILRRCVEHVYARTHAHTHAGNMYRACDHVLNCLFLFAAALSRTRTAQADVMRRQRLHLRAA